VRDVPVYFGDSARRRCEGQLPLALQREHCRYFEVEEENDARKHSHIMSTASEPAAPNDLRRRAELSAPT
jgi:hypothetical protein